jgi:transcriptional regulator with XRE-family HTH domain
MGERPQTKTLSRLDVGGLIREVRELAGLSQSELAQRIATTQAVVSRWERRLESPRVETLARVLQACGFEADLTFRRHDDEDRTQITWHLDMTPEDRARYFRGAVRAYRNADRARVAANA